MSLNQKKLHSVSQDDMSDVSSDHSEGTLAVQREIDKLTQAHIQVKPVTVDLTEMRKMLHTPKDGIVVPESEEYYIE